MQNLVTISDFQKFDFHIVRVVEAERLSGSDKLLVLKVSLGEVKDTDESETRVYIRQIVAGIGKAYDPEWLVGKQAVVIANLEPRMIMGVESQGMLVAADSDLGPVLIIPEKEVKDGASLR